MSKPTFRYGVTYGLAGCYMPDSNYGAYEGRTRRELAELIRDALVYHAFPKSLFREAHIRRNWAFIRHHGSSTAHFSIHHGANVLSFHGLTEDEYKQQVESDE